jgi:hypothetical protein
MSEHAIKYPGLDACYCSMCQIWVPTAYAIGVLEKSLQEQLQKKASYTEQHHSSFIKKASKPPQSLIDKIAELELAIAKARKIYTPHQEIMG